MKGLVSVLCLSAFLATGCAATAREVKIQQTQPKQKIEERNAQEQVEEKKPAIENSFRGIVIKEREEKLVERERNPYHLKLIDNLKADHRVYIEIFNNYIDSLAAHYRDEQYDEACLEAINNYQDFLKKYGNSELADEAELRIAELHYAIEAEKPKPNLSLVKSLLDRVIEQYPQADHYTIFRETNYPNELYLDINPANKEKTAALALYRKGTWLKSILSETSSKACFERILKEYPDSKRAYRDAQEELKRY